LRPDTSFNAHIEAQRPFAIEEVDHMDAQIQGRLGVLTHFTEHSEALSGPVVNLHEELAVL
jgi:hypothetical protein